ncbi:MAG: hypothetical protein JKY37_08955 [Nannocystaceae bacterium]|nr:hypothetical protein [Nannocystaceae bacterium]
MQLALGGISVSCVLLIGGLGCSKAAQPPPSTPPEPAPVASDVNGLRPGEIGNEYVGREDQSDPANKSDTNTTTGGDPDAAPPPDEGLTTAKVHALANAALDELLDPDAIRLVTPALPTEWPPTSGKVMVLAYPLEPMPTGVAKYRCGPAVAKVTISVADGTVQAEKVAGKRKSLGTIEEQRTRVDDPIFAAEQALIDVVAGTRKPRKAHYLLERYIKWIDAYANVGKDVTKRQSAFVTFVREPL